MPGDRTIMPSAARVQRGWRAGLRGQSRWLDAAAGLAAVGLVLGAIPWTLASAWGARWQAAIVRPERMRVLLEDAGWAAAALGVALAVAFGLARVLSAVFAGRIGPVDRGRLARLRVASSSLGAGSLVLLSLIALMAMGLAVRGVVAGAARSVDATASGTWQLWTAWPQRVWAAALVVLSLVGWVELILSRRKIEARLAQTAEQARADLKARGRR